MSGSEKPIIRRRNALLNSLKESCSKESANSTVRDALYSLAPEYIWQYFAATGKSRITRFSFREDLPNLFKVVVTTTAHITRLPQSVIITAISNVIKSCKHRRKSLTFRLSHPEFGLVDHSASISSLQENEDADDDTDCTCMSSTDDESKDLI